MDQPSLLRVSAAEAGQKLLQFLLRRLGRDIPKSAIMRWVRTGQVRVDKGRRKPFDRLEEGQTVRVPPYRPGRDESPAAAGDLATVFEDERLLALNKPAGLAAHGGTRTPDSLAARLAARFAAADFAPTLAHRLDKDTSGLILAAKTYAALRDLTAALADGTAAKTYLAWVRGDWPHDGPVLLEDRLGKVLREGRERVEAGSGKAARAEAAPLARRPGRTLLAVRLLTGRTHQIRVQLASRGHPVLGDRKYGPPGETPPLFLHSWKIEIGGLSLACPPDWPEDLLPPA